MKKLQFIGVSDICKRTVRDGLRRNQLVQKAKLGSLDYILWKNEVNTKGNKL